MTDAEIIKALECCTTNGASCKDCPAFVKVDRSNCKKYFRGALDLINRLQAENERLNFVRTRDAQRYEEKISNQAHTNCVLIDLHSATIKEVKELENKIKTAKAEAYKECIEMVKDLFDEDDVCSRRWLDIIFKKLVGEDK